MNKQTKQVYQIDSKKRDMGKSTRHPLRLRVYRYIANLAFVVFGRLLRASDEYLDDLELATQTAHTLGYNTGIEEMNKEWMEIIKGTTKKDEWIN